MNEIGVYKTAHILYRVYAQKSIYYNIIQLGVFVVLIILKNSKIRCGYCFISEVTYGMVVTGVQSSQFLFKLFPTG